MKYGRRLLKTNVFIDVFILCVIVNLLNLSISYFASKTTLTHFSESTLDNCGVSAWSTITDSRGQRSPQWQEVWVCRRFSSSLDIRPGMCQRMRSLLTHTAAPTDPWQGVCVCVWVCWAIRMAALPTCGNRLQSWVCFTFLLSVAQCSNVQKSSLIFLVFNLFIY